LEVRAYQNQMKLLTSNGIAYSAFKNWNNITVKIILLTKYFVHINIEKMKKITKEVKKDKKSWLKSKLDSLCNHRSCQ